MFTLISSSSLLPAAPAGLEWKSTEVTTEVAADQDAITAEFEGVNRSGKPVRIIAVLPSCECTQPKFSEAAVPPDGSAKIQVRFEAGQRSGEQKVHLIVWTDLPNDEPFELQWKIVLPEVLKLTPEVLAWKAGESGEKQVRIEFPAEKNVRITQAIPDEEESFRATVEENAVRVVRKGEPENPLSLLRITTTSKLRRLQEIVVPLAVENSRRVSRSSEEGNTFEWPGGK